MIVMAIRTTMMKDNIAMAMMTNMIRMVAKAMTPPTRIATAWCRCVVH